MNNKLLNTKQASEILGVSMAFLERDRWAGARIPFIKLGTRAVRYRIEDINNFLDSKMRVSTSDQGK